MVQDRLEALDGKCKTQTSVFCSLRGLDLFWKNLEKPGIEVGEMVPLESPGTVQLSL